MKFFTQGIAVLASFSSLAWAAMEPVSSGSFATATAISFNQINGDGLFCGESKYYRFDVVDNAQLIRVSGTGYEHAFVEKIDQGISASTGYAMPFEQASTNDGSAFQFVADPGRYYLRISESSVWCKELPTAHEVVVTAEPAPIDDYYELDTDVIDSLELTQRTQLNAALWNHDWRKITVPEGFNGFEIELQSLNGGEKSNNQPWVIVWDDRFENEIARSQDFNTKATAGFIAPGDYYLLVTSSNGSFDGDEYELTWQPIIAEDDIYEFNNNRYTAAFLREGATIDAVYWDDDWYELQVTEDQLNIDILLQHSLGNGNFRLQLTNSNGNQLFRWSSQAQGETSLLKTYQLPSAGTYYLKVFEESNLSGGEYQLNWQGR